MSNCPKCGVQLQGNEINCPNCGEILNKSNSSTIDVMPKGMELPMTTEAKVQLSNVGSAKSVLDDSESGERNMEMPTSNVSNNNLDNSVGEGKELNKQPEMVINRVQKLKDVDKIMDNTTVLKVDSKKKRREKKDKKRGNKSLYVILACLFVVLLFGGKVLLDMKEKSNQVVVENNNVVKENLESVNSNGFKFKMDSSWILSEDGEDILVFREDESLVIYFKKEKANFSLLNEADIKTAFESKSYVSNLEVSSIELGVRKAFLTKLDYVDEQESSKVEYYYLDGGSSLVIGVYVRYSDGKSYGDNKDKVTKMLEDLAYADESIKTFNMKSKYSGIFSSGRSIFY